MTKIVKQKDEPRGNRFNNIGDIRSENAIIIIIIIFSPPLLCL